MLYGGLLFSSPRTPPQAPNGYELHNWQENSGWHLVAATTNPPTQVETLPNSSLLMGHNHYALEHKLLVKVVEPKCNIFLNFYYFWQV